MSDPTTPPNGTVPPAVAPTTTAAPAAPLAPYTPPAPIMPRDDFRMMLEPQNFEQVKVLASMVAKTGMFRCKSPEDAALRIMTGRALGLPMFASLKGLYSVEAKDGSGSSVGIESKLKVALARQLAVCEYVRCKYRGPDKATYVAKRRGEPEFELTFTIEEARAAGLFDRGEDDKAKKLNNWNRWPSDMVMSKASGKIVDIVFPEAALGLDSAEDLRDENAIVTTGEVVSETVAPVQGAPTRDYAADAKTLKDRITAAQTDNARKAVRKDVASFIEDPGAGAYGDEVKQFYNAAIAKASAQATTPPAAATPQAATGNKPPEAAAALSNLFGDTPQAGR